MHGGFASEGTKRCMIVTNWSIGIRPRLCVRFQSWLSQDVERHYCLRNKQIQQIFGKSASITVRIDRNCALNVWMARSAALRRWRLGGTSWYSTLQMSCIVALYYALASLSNFFRSTRWFCCLMRVMVSLYVRSRSESLCDLKGATRVALESQWYKIMSY